jgi:hypothetical protein
MKGESRESVGDVFSLLRRSTPMNKRDIQRLYKSLETSTSEDDEYAQPPTEAELDRFEDAFSLKVPKSYRTFVSVFGPGELAEVFRITVPYCKVRAFDMVNDTTAHQKRFQGQMAWLARRSYDDPDQVARMIIIATTYRGEQYAWDPQAVTDSRSNEYRVHLLRRSTKSPEVIADSYSDFITEYCLGDRFLQFYDEDTRSKSFSPAYL